MRITLFINVITRIIRFYYAGVENLCHLFNLLIYFINTMSGQSTEYNCHADYFIYQRNYTDYTILLCRS